MQPGEGFWDGLGQGFASSPGWMIVGALLVIGVLFIVARYIVPSRERIKMRELDIREKEAQSQQALAENLHGIMESNNFIAREFSAQNAGIEESKARSREMGVKIDRIESTTAHAADTVDDTNAKVTEMHQRTRDIYNMLNGRGN